MMENLLRLLLLVDRKPNMMGGRELHLHVIWICSIKVLIVQALMDLEHNWLEIIVFPTK